MARENLAMSKAKMNECVKNDSPVIASLREKLLKDPPTDHTSTRRLKDLTLKQFSEKYNCTVDQARKISETYRQVSEKCRIPRLICASILDYPGENISILINRLTDIVNKKAEQKIPTATIVFTKVIRKIKA